MLNWRIGSGLVALACGAGVACGTLFASPHLGEPTASGVITPSLLADGDRASDAEDSIRKRLLKLRYDSIAKKIVPLSLTQCEEPRGSYSREEEAEMETLLFRIQNGLRPKSVHIGSETFAQRTQTYLRSFGGDASWRGDSGELEELYSDYDFCLRNAAEPKTKELCARIGEAHDKVSAQLKQKYKIRSSEADPEPLRRATLAERYALHFDCRIQRTSGEPADHQVNVCTRIRTVFELPPPFLTELEVRVGKVRAGRSTKEITPEDMRYGTCDAPLPLRGLAWLNYRSLRQQLRDARAVSAKAVAEPLKVASAHADEMLAKAVANTAFRNQQSLGELKDELKRKLEPELVDKLYSDTRTSNWNFFASSENNRKYDALVRLQDLMKDVTRKTEAVARNYQRALRDAQTERKYFRPMVDPRTGDVFLAPTEALMRLQLAQIPNNGLVTREYQFQGRRGAFILPNNAQASLHQFLILADAPPSSLARHSDVEPGLLPETAPLEFAAGVFGVVVAPEAVGAYAIAQGLGSFALGSVKDSAFDAMLDQFGLPDAAKAGIRLAKNARSMDGIGLLRSLGELFPAPAAGGDHGAASGKTDNWVLALTQHPEVIGRDDSRREEPSAGARSYRMPIGIPTAATAREIAPLPPLNVTADVRSYRMPIGPPAATTAHEIAPVPFPPAPQEPADAVKVRERIRAQERADELAKQVPRWEKYVDALRDQARASFCTCGVRFSDFDAWQNGERVRLRAAVCSLVKDGRELTAMLQWSAHDCIGRCEGLLQLRASECAAAPVVAELQKKIQSVESVVQRLKGDLREAQARACAEPAAPADIEVTVPDPAAQIRFGHGIPSDFRNQTVGGQIGRRFTTGLLAGCKRFVYTIEITTPVRVRDRVGNAVWQWYRQSKNVLVEAGRKTRIAVGVDGKWL